AVICSTDGVLPNPLRSPGQNPVALAPRSASNEKSVSLTRVRGAFWESQRTFILQALCATGWVVGGPRGAAARLGLKRTTLTGKMKKLGISRPSRQNDIDGLNQNGEGGGSNKPLNEIPATDLER